jgi:hypothetical protein
MYVYQFLLKMLALTTNNSTFTLTLKKALNLQIFVWFLRADYIGGKEKNKHQHKKTQGT